MASLPLLDPLPQLLLPSRVPYNVFKGSALRNRDGKNDQHYVDPRLVDLYDIENTRGADTDFYLSLARNGSRVILDLGCGTGVLTRELVSEGRRVIGVDPTASAMLAVARRHPGAERVQWVEGDSSALGTPGADLVIMTGNVVQVFLGMPVGHYPARHPRRPAAAVACLRKPQPR